MVKSQLLDEKNLDNNLPKNYGAKPFLKWAGGKTQLLTQFENYYPQELKEGRIEKYFEPFLGSGAVFFELAQKYKIRNFYLSDINADLIITYLVVKTEAEKLINILMEYSQIYSSSNESQRKNLFYEVRKDYNFQRSVINYQKYSENWIRRAAQVIFLNRTCFNGLFRTNSKGDFNVPFGGYKKPNICNTNNLMNVANFLKKAEITIGNFDIFDSLIDENSFVYLDPPYRPISKTSSFTSYSKVDFDDKSQVELSEYYINLDKTRKAKLMLSNSDPTNINSADTFFENLYKDYQINKVYANRMVNSVGNKRGKITELLITNY